MDHNYIVKSEDFMLRPLEFGDLEDLRKWRNTDTIRKWFVDQSLITSSQQANWYTNYLKKENDLFFIIVDLKISLRPVGACSLYNINYEGKEAEFGRFMIGDPAARGIGLGQKTLEAICEFSREVLSLNSMYLEVLSDNKAAIKVYERVGYKIIDGFISKNTIKMSKQLNTLIYGSVIE
ncbi:hypothetical protein ASG89_07960 [Paenibacillus sp. Soil766]|uniref:GNAT family N-acetyltransferase n=1 Tax=Paenibacillus sp. Soil766 TaxID=1736404 RepID=UPI00070E71AD|nr:GNAT family N-acetyltransferase [Paenibacillus sp. Soil766]KRE90233.1 hypothetical protein ASG89_07960 [Paenibacillus sp. Soil766]